SELPPPPPEVPSVSVPGQPTLVITSYDISDLLKGTPPESARRTILDTATERMTILELMHFITGSISQESWATYGGRGSMDYTSETKALVVRQTADMQEQVEDLLNALRKLQVSTNKTVAELLSEKRYPDPRLVPNYPFLPPEY